MKKIVVFGAIAVFFALSQFSEHLFPVVAEPVPVVEEVLPDKAFIYVTGAVHRPGLYALAGEQTVGEAVETAGGMAAYADTTAVNLAERAADGMHVHIPYDWNGVPPAPIDEGKVSLNQADAEKTHDPARYRTGHGGQYHRLPSGTRRFYQHRRIAEGQGNRTG